MALREGAWRKFLPRRAARWILGLLTQLGWLGPLVSWYTRRLEEHLPTSTGAPVSQGRVVVLALNPQRFRGDLDVLARTGQFQIWRLPFRVQALTIPIFYGRPIPAFHLRSVVTRPKVQRSRDSHRAFLRRILHGLRRRLGIQLVIGAAVHYRQDHDWGAAAKDLGIPYVVFHREGTISSLRWAEGLVGFYERFVPFEGTHIITQTEVSRSIFVESGYASPTQVSVGGALRMDEYLTRIGSYRSDHERKQAVLFSFNHAVGIPPQLRGERFEGKWSRDGTTGYVQLFRDVHAAFARVAARNPGTRFVIKAKWGGDWPERIRDAIENAGPALHGLTNLEVTTDQDAQDLILGSDVVCGFASTTLLEAGVAGKPVIVPHFAEATSEPMRGYVPFLDTYDVFDVASSVAEFETLIEERLVDCRVGEVTMARRRDAFRRYVSLVEGTAVARYLQVLRSVVGGFQKESHQQGIDASVERTRTT